MTRSAYHHTLAGAAVAGRDVIGDHVLSELLDPTTEVDVLPALTSVVGMGRSDVASVEVLIVQQTVAVYLGSRNGGLGVVTRLRCDPARGVVLNRMR